MPKAIKQNTTSKKSSVSPDPIFAALYNTHKLDRRWLDLCPVLEQAELAAKKHTPRAAAELAALRRKVDRAYAAAENAAWKMARTKPNTAAGASEMLTYIATDKVTGLFELGETPWHETAFRTVTAALAKIAGQSQRPAA